MEPEKDTTSASTVIEGGDAPLEAMPAEASPLSTADAAVEPEETQATLDAALAQAGELVKEVSEALGSAAPSQQEPREQAEPPSAVVPESEAAASVDAPSEPAHQEVSTTEPAAAVEVPPEKAPEAPKAPSVAESPDDPFGGFENPDELIKQAKEAERVAVEAEQASLAATSSLSDLDAALASEAEKSLESEDATNDSPAPSGTTRGAVEASSAPAAPKSVEATNKPAPKIDGSGGAGAAGASRGSGASSPVAGRAAPSAEPALEAEHPKGHGLRHVAGRVCRPFQQLALKVLGPTSKRYERLGREKHKIVKMVSIGTALQAMALWGYLLFGRTTDEAALEAAANARPGAVHPVEASLHGSGAEHGHEPAAADGHGTSHQAAADHATEPAHAEGGEHGHH